MYLVRYYNECCESVQRMPLVCVFNRLRIIEFLEVAVIWYGLLTRRQVLQALLVDSVLDVSTSLSRTSFRAIRNWRAEPTVCFGCCLLHRACSM
jgi:hypothetical protein